MSDEFIAGVDLGGTNTHVAVANASGEIVVQRQVSTDAHEGPAAVMQRIASIINQLASPLNGSLKAIGVGCPGLVDIQHGCSKFFPNLPTQWRDVAIAEQLSVSCKCPVKILNDARAATLGELVFGRGRDQPDLSMAFFSIGTGIGGGLVHQGKLVLGSLGAAGELGHQTLLANGPRCGCGNRGCLETLASGSAITAAGVRLLRSGLAPQMHEAVSGDANLVTPRIMASAADQGDQLVAEAIDDAATFIGIAAANVVTIFHPQLVVLGGGVSVMGDRIVSPVAATIHERVGMFPTDDVRIELSALGTRAGVMGAIALAAGKC